MKKLIFALTFIFLFSFLALAFGQDAKEETHYVEIYVEIICDGPWNMKWGNITGDPHGEKQGQGNYVWGPFEPEIYFGNLMIMLARTNPGGGQSPLVASILIYTDMGLSVLSASTYEDYIFLVHNVIWGQPGPNQPPQNKEQQMPNEPDETNDYNPRSFCLM